MSRGIAVTASAITKRDATMNFLFLLFMGGSVSEVPALWQD